MDEEHKPRRRRSNKNVGLDGTKSIEALNNNQHKVLVGFRKNHLVLHGFPGTGKTFLALYCAINAVLHGDYERIIILRSSVAGRDIGFLPGSAEEKMAAYEEPYIGVIGELFSRDDAYGILKVKGLIEFRSTSNNRGLTFRNSIVMVDEAQNMGDQELHTVITRLDGTSKLIICGDVLQDDLTSERFKEISGLTKIMKILEMLPDVVFVDFTVDDIVRSGFVKDYIIARAEYETGKPIEVESDVGDFSKVIKGWGPSQLSGFTPGLGDTLLRNRTTT